jgi:hypothetical protein
LIRTIGRLTNCGTPPVSVLSDAGVPLEEISRLVGHSRTTVMELVYRHQLKPVIQTGAAVMDQLFRKQAIVSALRQLRARST